jgi:hypothetical protein
MATIHCDRAAALVHFSVQSLFFSAGELSVNCTTFIANSVAASETIPDA